MITGSFGWCYGYHQLWIRWDNDQEAKIDQAPTSLRI